MRHVRYENIAQGSVPESYSKPIKGYDEAVDTARQLLKDYDDLIVLPEDAAVERDGERVECSFDEMNSDPFFDIGAGTMSSYIKAIKNSAVVFANGPMGFFEKDAFALGTKGVLDAIASCDGITVVGGGHLGSMALKNELSDRITHISTGGGATINFLTGKTLDLIAALEAAARRMDE